MKFSSSLKYVIADFIPVNIANDVYIDKRTGLPFSCDKCKSPHIVDPARCSPGNRKRPPTPRKYVDPQTGRIMLLCNACGIAAKTNRKDRGDKKTRVRVGMQ